MSLPVKYPFQWNIPSSEMSLPEKCPFQWNIPSSEMSLAVKCPCQWNVSSSEMSLILIFILRLKNWLCLSQILHVQNTTFLFRHSFKKKTHTISALPGTPMLYYLEFAHVTVVAKQQPLFVQIVLCFQYKNCTSLEHVIGCMFASLTKLYYLEFAHVTVVAKQQPLFVQIVLCFQYKNCTSLEHVIGCMFASLWITWMTGWQQLLPETVAWGFSFYTILQRIQLGCLLYVRKLTVAVEAIQSLICGFERM